MLLVSAVLVAISSVGSGQYLEEGDLCGPDWRCRKLSDCLTGQNDLKAGNNPEICSFDGMLPIVCCRPDDREVVGNRWPVVLPETTTQGRHPVRPSRPAVKKSISQRKCEEYAEYVYRKEQAPVLAFEPQIVRVNECGRVEEPLIVGGMDAKLKEFPHMAQIGYGNTPRIAWLCGGSLISERWILSAAHCTNPESKGPAKWARLGDLDTANEYDGARPEVLKIVQRVDHPDYTNARLYNDIALYKLERNIDLNPHIRPICLQTDRYIDQPAAIASGWGHTNWGGRPSNRLKKVSLNLVPNRECNDTYSDSIGKHLPSGIVDAKMVCAGDEEGKDTCQGDSGGPLQIPLHSPYCMYAQIGVTSFGRGCAHDHPGVYTRVSFYVPWIESVVWPGQ